MATSASYPEDVSVGGTLSANRILGQVREDLSQDDLQGYELPLADFRVWDAFQTLLGTAATDDLGVTAGAFATGLPYITTGDVKALGSVTRYARTTFTLPPEYVDGETIRLRFAAGMLTTVAATSATLDAEVYKSARTTLKTGSDLVSTSAQSINSLTFAEKTFDVSAVGIVAGDVLDIRVAIATNDAATGTAVIGAIAHAEIQLDIKG